MTRVMVTGASGLLGANLVLAWAGRHQVVAVTHNGGFAHPGVEARQADLSQPATARRLMDETRPQVVVHCAAATDVDACERDPAFAHRLNCEMAGAVAQAAAASGARLLHISTDGVFPGDGGPYAEDDEAIPVNAYGRSKLAGEKVVHQEHPAALVVRTTFFGWSARGGVGLAEWFLERLRAGQRAAGFTDVFWSPLLVNHLAEILEDLMKGEVPGILHLAGATCLSKFDFGRALARVFGMPEERVVPGRVDESTLQAPRPLRTCLDGSRARSVLGRATPDVEAGLMAMAALERAAYPARLRKALET